MVALGSCLFNRAVHSLDLTINSGMANFGGFLLDAVFVASHFEHVGCISRHRRSAGLSGAGSVVDQDGLYLKGDSGERGYQESGRGDLGRLLNRLVKGELAGPVDADK